MNKNEPYKIGNIGIPENPVIHPVCCTNPTCDASTTPPFIGKAKCLTCGKECSECEKMKVKRV